MIVSEILSNKGRNVFTTTSNSTLQNVASVLAQKKIGAAVVIDDDNRVCGIASERDIVREIARSGPAALDQSISSCMTQKVISCSETESVDALMEKMTKGRFRHLPVIENGELTGIISIGDVVKIKIQQAEHEAEEMKRYIAG
jgi:CBS domain-containing protein